MNPNASYTVSYLDQDGIEDEIEVDAEDAFDAEEAARGDLTARHPSVDTDEWEILSVRMHEAAPSP